MLSEQMRRYPNLTFWFSNFENGELTPLHDELAVHEWLAAEIAPCLRPFKPPPANRPNHSTTHL